MNLQLLRQGASPYKLILAVSAAVASAAAVMTSALLAGRAIDGHRVVGWFALVLVVSTLFQWLYRFIATRLVWEMTARLRSRCYSSVLAFPIATFSTRSVGELVDRVDEDVHVVGYILAESGLSVVNATAGAVLALGIVGFTNWRIAVILIVGAVIMSTLPRRAARRVLTAQTEIETAWSAVTSCIEEGIAARDDLRANLGRGLLTRRYSQESHILRAAATRGGKAQASLARRADGSVHAMLVACQILATWLVISRHNSIGQGLALVLLASSFVTQLNRVVNNLPELYEGFGALVRIRQLLDEPTEPDGVQPPGISVDWGSPVGIEIDDCSFSYGPQPVLHDVNISVRAGRSCGLVGRSGSGKSTLVKLLLRIEQVDRGNVFIGGVDVCDIPRSQLRAHVGLIAQRTELLDASLRDNITLFDPDISDRRVLDAIVQLHLTDWYDAMAQGLNTPIGLGGISLSAGEAQLVAFARLLVRDPAIVILDEATSRLDPGTESVVRTATDRLLAGRTAVVVAHRLATLAGIDDMVILAHGSVLEHGTSAVLLADPDSAYRRLVELTGSTTIRHDPIAISHRASLRTVPPAPEAHAQLSLKRSVAELSMTNPKEGVLGTMGFLISAIAIPALSAWAWGRLLAAAAHQPFSALWPYMAILIASEIAGVVLRSIGYRFWSVWWTLANMVLRANILAAQIHPSRPTPRPRTTGEAVARVLDSNKLIRVVDNWLDLIAAFLVTVVATAVAGSWWVLPILLGTVGMPIIIALVTRGIAGRLSHRATIARGRLASLCVSAFGAATSIKLFTSEGSVIAALDVHNRERTQAVLAENRYRVWIDGAPMLMGTLAKSIILAQYLNGNIVLSITVLLIAMVDNTAPGGWVGARLVGNVAAAKAWLYHLERLLPGDGIFHLARLPEDIDLSTIKSETSLTAVSERRVLKHLELHNVEAIYPDGVIGLNGVTCQLRQGQLAIVTGPVGSGKSTLLKVLAGLVAPTDGYICYNGELIEDLASLMRPSNIAYVPQVPTLVSGSFTENIVLDHDNDAEWAAHRAQLYSDVYHAGGFGTQIGHRGLRLSGGQSQRVALARALAHRSELLILDDVSSALDVETETDLWQALRAEGATVIATSYKKVALAQADWIIILDQGKVIAEGRYPDLILDHGHLFA